MPDGKANMTAPVPKTANGKPDLSGVWLGDQWSPAGRRRILRALAAEVVAAAVAHPKCCRGPKKFSRSAAPLRFVTIPKLAACRKVFPRPARCRIPLKS